MDLKDNISLLISILSACTAVVSVIVSRRAIEKQRYVQSWLTNYDLLNRTTNMLLQDHSLLRLLGIEPDELIKDGVTPDELIFINASMDASHALYRIGGGQYNVLSEYRKNFLKNDKVRRVWKKYLRNLFNKTPWTEAVDAYIVEFEAAGSV